MQANLRESRHRRKVLDGMPDTRQMGKSVKPIWYKIARMLLNAGVTNFERFIHAQHLHSMDVPGEKTLSHAANPGIYDTPRALQRFKTHDSRADDDMKQNWKSNALLFECSVNDAAVTFPQYTDRQLWNYVLRTQLNDLPPLFRYCLAVAEGLEDPQEMYYASALNQFMTDPIGYLRNWGDNIPPRLKEDAEILLMEKL
jgi:hypothetical protein